jgi:hypothetical protein
LFDKISILEIKTERLRDPDRRANVERELQLLRKLARDADDAGFREERSALKRVNERLWEVEDRLRELEATADFGAEFVALARSVYRLNDQRAEIKRRINLAAGSTIVEEKSYAGMPNADGGRSHL